MKQTWNQNLIRSCIQFTKEDLKQNNLTFFQKQFLTKQLEELQKLKQTFFQKKVTYLDKEQILRKDVYKDYQRIPLWIKRKILESISLYEDYEKDAFYK